MDLKIVVIIYMLYHVIDFVLIISLQHGKLRIKLMRQLMSSNLS